MQRSCTRSLLDNYLAVQAFSSPFEVLYSPWVSMCTVSFCSVLLRPVNPSLLNRVKDIQSLGQEAAVKVPENEIIPSILQGNMSFFPEKPIPFGPHYLRCGSVVKNPPDDAVVVGWLPGSGRSPGEENGNPHQYSCPGKSHGHRSLEGYSPCGNKSWTRLSN